MERIYTSFPRERRARQAVTGREKIGILFCSRRAWRARRARRLAWISCAAVSCRVSRSRHPVERSSWATTTADRHIHRLAASAPHADRARASAPQPATTFRLAALRHAARRRQPVRQSSWAAPTAASRRRSHTSAAQPVVHSAAALAHQRQAGSARTTGWRAARSGAISRARIATTRVYSRRCSSASRRAPLGIYSASKSACTFGHRAAVRSQPGDGTRTDMACSGSGMRQSECVEASAKAFSHLESVATARKKTRF